MAPHSSTVVWKIPWMEEPGRLQSTGSLRVGHDWVTSLSLFTFMHWRRKWQPTPVFLPGESPESGEPGGLPSMGSHRIGHDWSDLPYLIHTTKCKTASGELLYSTGPQLCALWWPRGVGLVGGDGRQVQEEGDISILTADPLHCTAETNTTLRSNYTQKKKSTKNKKGAPRYISEIPGD